MFPQLVRSNTGERRTLLKTLHAGALLLVGLILLALPAKSEPLRRPGRLVDLGGFRLHLNCRGIGEPTVIVDAGMGSLSLEWLDVQAALARQARICLYDRAGYAWSDLGPTPRTSSHIVNELFLLLDHADITGPFVLIGHSYGGLNMQLFASRYSWKTAGVVLVESSHPEQIERFKVAPYKVNMAPQGRSGQVRFSRPRLPENLSPRLRVPALKMLRSYRTRTAMADEFLSFKQSASQVRDGMRFPSVPMMVLTRGKHMWRPNNHGRLKEALWLKLQQELVARSPYAAHLVANRSGHHIHLDQPGLVVDAVSLILKIVRHNLPRGRIMLAPRQLPIYSPPSLDDANWLSDSLHLRLMPGLVLPVRLKRSEFFAADYTPHQ